MPAYLLGDERVFPLPEVQRHDAILFPSFEQGFLFLRDLQRSGAVPASVRLVDNLQFQLSQTLKPRAEGAAALKRPPQTAPRFQPSLPLPRRPKT
mgnify:CR=1 FL=1